jgi:hypothetical protein
VSGELVSDLAVLHQGIDIALSLRLLQAVLGYELRHEIAVTIERGQILLREFAPRRPDFLETFCLVSAAVSGFAAAALEATFVV